MVLTQATFPISNSNQISIAVHCLTSNITASQKRSNHTLPLKMEPVALDKKMIQYQKNGHQTSVAPYSPEDYSKPLSQLNWVVIIMIISIQLTL